MKKFPQADRYGVGLVIPSRGSLLWAISTPNFWRRRGGRFYVYFQGVGGGVEEGETFLRAAFREGEEELGLRPDLLDSNRTFFVDDIRRTVTTVRLRNGIRPLFIHRHRVNRLETLVAYNYLSKLSDVPIPSSEVPALLSMPVERLVKGGTTTIRQHLREGCVLKEQVHIPRGAYLRPWGTPSYLPRLLKNGYLSKDPVSWLNDDSV